MFGVSGTYLRIATLGVALWGFTSPAHVAAASVDPLLKLAASRPGRDPLTVRVLIYSPVPIGAYTVDVSFDPAVLELVAVDGGKAAEFNAAPLSNPAAFASGTVRMSAFQMRRLEGPSGAVHVATLRLQPRAGPATQASRKLRRTELEARVVVLADTHGVTYRPAPRRTVLRYRGR